jgi:hypothetical protein
MHAISFGKLYFLSSYFLTKVCRLRCTVRRLYSLFLWPQNFFFVFWGTKIYGIQSDIGPVFALTSRKVLWPRVLHSNYLECLPDGDSRHMTSTHESILRVRSFTSSVTVKAFKRHYLKLRYFFFGPSALSMLNWKPAIQIFVSIITVDEVNDTDIYYTSL